ncbi:HAMP domain-containing sensor histidine kinase [Micromonospora sp. WMMD1155]|uniref:sensor histidine kinase n=1 Tax=Micromonospora sp. WMMD1155 TaxID=3016094 RepID=UPI00249C0FC3|nr:HAMP domain-containing sensor histidine kinase [Micromonospora sp. WMMD1155]WFE48805.1 HAMP domain-containing sensor histidine kinase [Micromonospora sp. WMMD1155]WFE54957.1 HAMP domain-containing sensor histidine kinase [Micromonospora sp. WMMD1155]
MQTAARLVRLRVWLTVLLLVLNVAGLAGMGAVALVIDGRQRAQVETAEMQRTASTAVALLTYESGVLRLHNLFTDPAGQGSTGVFVYEGMRTDVTLVFAHPAGLPIIASHHLLAPAREVWRTGAGRTLQVPDVDTDSVRLLAVPFRHAVTRAVAGTVVVVGDPRPGKRAHRNLAAWLLVGGLVFMLVAGFGGHLLARRGTRPAAEALTQQERFLADAAHELRTPLTVIRATAEAALTDPERKKPPDALRQVLGSAERLSAAVDVLLTRARLVAGLRDLQRQPFRLDQLAEEVVAELVTPPHSAAIDTTVAITDGDPTLIRIALQNLVSNALRHGRIGAEPCALSLTVRPGEVRITDRGPGIADSAPARFTTGAADGIGLGLSIAAWVGLEHGGHLRLEAVPTGGTLAVLTLPRQSGNL